MSRLIAILFMFALAACVPQNSQTNQQREKDISARLSGQSGTGGGGKGGAGGPVAAVISCALRNSNGSCAAYSCKADAVSDCSRFLGNCAALGDIGYGSGNASSATCSIAS